MKRFAVWAVVLALLTALLIRWAYIERGGWGAGGEWFWWIVPAVMLAADEGEEQRKGGTHENGGGNQAGNREN